MFLNESVHSSQTLILLKTAQKRRFLVSKNAVQKRAYSLKRAHFFTHWINLNAQNILTTSFTNTEQCERVAWHTWLRSCFTKTDYSFYFYKKLVYKKLAVGWPTIEETLVLISDGAKQLLGGKFKDMKVKLQFLAPSTGIAEVSKR